MFRGDSASSTAAGQSAVVRRENGPGQTVRTSASQPLLSRRKFGPHWAAVMASAVLAGSGAYHGMSSIKNWVRNRAPFPVPAENIRIYPDPPAWLTDARARILDALP